MSHIEELHQCIQSDQAKLEGAYEKSIATVDKNLTRLTVSLDKINKKIAKVKMSKKKSVDKSLTSTLLSLENELALIKAEKSSLENGHKKWVAQQKVIKQFEKDWAKKLKQSKSKAKRKKDVYSPKQGPADAPQIETAQQEDVAHF